MKRILPILVGLFLAGAPAGAQILQNFNKNISGIEKAGDSGPGLDSLYKAQDPLNSANGVLAMHFKFDSTTWHGRMEFGSIGNATYFNANGAQFVTFWVYLDSAQDIPDSLQIDTYAMNNNSSGNGLAWAWTEDEHFAVDIPKNVWYPLSFPLMAHHAQNPNFDIVNNQFMTGLQVFPHGSNFTGTIYVDNVGLVGSMPHYIPGGQFLTAADAGKYEKASDSGPGLDSLYFGSDPANATNGVLAMHFKFDSTTWHGRMELGTIGNATYIDAKGAQFITYWVYLDSAQNIPDSLQIDTYAMNNNSSGNGLAWAWTEDEHFAVDIPKNVWYPLSFPLMAHHAQNPNFDIVNNQFMTGLQVFPHDTTFTGTIYVDNIALLDTVVAGPPPVWHAANFENQSGNKIQGFYVPSYAGGTLTNVADLATSNGTYVLRGAADFGQAPHKFALVRDTVAMKDADSAATGVSFDVYIPSKMPKHAAVHFFLSGGAGDSVAVVDTVGSATMKQNQWNTISIMKLDSLASAGKFDPTKPARIGLVVWYPAPYDTTSWKGNLMFDNLTVYGIWFPNQIVDGIKGGNLAKSFKLYNNYPNPFNPTTVVRYDLPTTSKVVLKVYDVLGREVATIVNAKQPAGSYKLDLNMSRYASGLYFLRLSAGQYVRTQKMMLLK